MRGTTRLGLVAAAATLLATAPLSTIFERWTWLIQSCLAVAVVAGVAALVRWLRAPAWVQPPSMLAGLLLALTWLFPSEGGLLALVPTAGTFAHFATLFTGSMHDIRSYGIPVPDTEPLLFITVLGVGVVAVVVDVATVGLRHPALAGLPMLAIYAVPVAVYVDSVPPLSFIIGAIGFLWLLAADNVDRVRRFGRRFTGDGKDIGVWEPSPLAVAGRRLAVVGVVLAVLLPLAVPGMTAGLLNYNPTGGNGAGQGGSTGRVDLFASLSGQLNQSAIIDLVTVTTTDPNPFYLRFGVADDLQPDGFRVRTARGRPVTRGLPDPRQAPPNGVSHPLYRATVQVSPNFNMPLLPIYADPVAMRSVDSSWLYDPNMQIVYSNRSMAKGKQYSFDFVRSNYSPTVLAAAPPLPANDPLKQQFTVVPTVREVEDLVAQLTKGKRSDYDRVRAIYDYFSASNNFRYSLQTQGGTSGQDIVNFLTNKAGFCQQYAAAMAWLVRAAGIPARVVFGFTNGTSQRAGTYALTNRNLHAWTEVYFSGIGWVPFDATPAAGVPGSTRPAWAPDTDAPKPVTPSTGPNAAAGVVPSAGPSAAARPQRDPDTGVAAASGPVRSPASSQPWWIAAGIILLLALLALPAQRRAALRRRRQTGGAAALTPVARDPAPGTDELIRIDHSVDRARTEAHAAWDELIDTLIDFRLSVDSTETPRATADRLVRDSLADGPAVDAVRLLGRAEERARYARDPLQGGQLGKALAPVRRALAAGSSRRVRLVAAILPPSVLLRWRLATMEGSSRFLATTTRLRPKIPVIRKLLRRFAGA